MTNLKATKKALVSSVLALVMCFTMLLGTTFAWFTDSVTSSGNMIQSGTLDVELWQHYADQPSRNITNESDPIFGKADSETANANTANTLWEPGKTQTVYLSIKNNGTLDLKYSVAIEVTNVEENLHEVFEYIITPDAKVVANPVTKDQLKWNESDNRVTLGMNVASESPTALKKNEEHFFALSVHMDELAGNEYQNGNITFNIKVLAGQLASEEDSFDNTYDHLAQYPNGYYVVPSSANGIPVAGFEVEYHNADGLKIATATIPTAALANGVSVGEFKLVEIETDENLVPDEEGYTGLSYDITLTGVRANNTDEIVVQFRLPDKMDDDTIQLYHNGQPINFTYNYKNGFVSFKTTSFSPFTAVYDETSIAPELKNEMQDTNESNLPKANVVNSSEYVNVELPWGSYGQWSPTEGLDSKLEAAYTFSCVDTLEEAKNSPYANWHCDFVVSLDKDLGENQLFLGGNYGSFGWVGFHNGDLTLEAGTEVKLLGSVTGDPWTYMDVVEYVGTFICGVGDVNDSLRGATFTVMLRLTNPNDETDFYNVETIKYTFN